MAQEIPPLGTAANDSVRNYILDELTQLGIEPSIQEGVGVSSRLGGGLLGAEQFVDTFPELEQINLVLNFEARGSSGASMMFETSSPNDKLIPHFAEATPHPVANSLMYTVYKLLPTDEQSESGTGVTYFNDFSEPITLNLTLDKNEGKPEITFSFIKKGLPTPLISNYENRTPDMMPKPFWISNSSVWQITVNTDTLADSE